jgi:hypothetical protein
MKDNSVNKNLILAAVGLVLMAGPTSPVMAADSAKSASASQPDADTILKNMSEKLAAAKQFSFTATREINVTSEAGGSTHSKSDVEVIVQRPNHAVASSISSEGARRMYFDGNEFTLLVEKDKIYSTVPMKTSLDDLPAHLAAVYGFAPPLADFTTSDPYKDLKFRAQSISYAGTDRAGTPPVECHRLALSGTLANAELWLAVSDSLPRKMTAKVTGGVGAGTDLKIEFTSWNLMAPITAQTFVFVPPKDAFHTRMITVEEMESAAGKN